jgi:putative membrane protein
VAHGLPALPAWMWVTPTTLFWVALAGVAYVWLGYGPVKSRWPEATPPTRRQAWAFAMALLTLYLSLGSPLGVLAMGYLFAAHMTQHMLAALVVPPLAIAGVPPWMWRRFLGWGGMGRIWRWMTRPLVAIFVFNVVFGLMVAPPVITAMVRSNTIMVGLHLLLVVVGLFMWWPLLSPLPEFPRLHPGFRVLYLFLDGLPMILPLAIVVLDTSPLYAAAYGAAPRIWGLSLVGDQQLGAAICLIGVHVAFGWLALGWFRQWAVREHERDVRTALGIDGMPVPAGEGELRAVRPRS